MRRTVSPPRPFLHLAVANTTPAAAVSRHTIAPPVQYERSHAVRSRHRARADRRAGRDQVPISLPRGLRHGENGLYGHVRHTTAFAGSFAGFFARSTCWPTWDGHAGRHVRDGARPALRLDRLSCCAGCRSSPSRCHHIRVQMAWHVRTVRQRTDFRFVDDSTSRGFAASSSRWRSRPGCRHPYVGVIDSPALNAFACGIREKDAVLVFPRGLIDGLTTRSSQPSPRTRSRTSSTATSA